jgi:hypothetical protein
VQPSRGARQATATVVFNVYTSAYPSPDLAAAGAAEQHLMDDLEPWSDGGALVNFLAGPWVTTADLEAAYDSSTWARLREIKAHWDPDDLFRFNHSIPAGGPR